MFALDGWDSASKDLHKADSTVMPCSQTNPVTHIHVGTCETSIAIGQLQVNCKAALWVGITSAHLFSEKILWHATACKHPRTLKVTRQVVA